MLQIKQFRYSADNLGYVLYGLREAIAIDDGAVDGTLAFLKERNLKLTVVTNTHHHVDHTSGNQQLVHKTGARLIESANLADGEKLFLEGTPILVYRTPGHSEDSICFHAERFLISGDTLFNGTVGNCFSGDLEAFYRSIKKIMSLPEDTVVYAGHDYVSDSVAYATLLEPQNDAIRCFLERYSPDHVFSTLKDELQINPYLRMNAPAIVAFLKDRGLPCETEWQRWESLMKMG